MASSRARVGFAVGLLLLAVGCAAPRASLRAPAPGWEETRLVSTSGEVGTVGQLLSSAEATVFVFWSSGCPCVRRYQARVDALAADWSARGVHVVQVSSNAGESLEALRAAAAERQLPLPIWRDEGGLLARALGARSTPTVALVRRDGKLLYRGWLDNEREPGEPGREPWLELALARVGEGLAAATSSPTWGCTITRSLSAREGPTCQIPPGPPEAPRVPSLGGAP